MWLVAQSGAWYRVAGPLCSGQLHQASGREEEETAAAAAVTADEGSSLPSSRSWYVAPETFPCEEAYRPYLVDAMEKFFVSAHVIFSLMDIAQFNKQLNYEQVCDESSLRSFGVVSKEALIRHYSFLIEQIKAIPPPVHRDGTVGTYSESRFAKNLEKDHAKSLRAEERAAKEKLSAARAEEIAATALFKRSAPPPPKNSKQKSPAAAVTATAAPKVVTPPVLVTQLPDAEYWAMLASHDLHARPFPYPHDRPLTLETDDPSELGSLMHVWNFLSMYRDRLKLPVFSPDILLSALRSKPRAFPPMETPAPLGQLAQRCALFGLSDGWPFLVELHITLMSPLMRQWAMLLRDPNRVSGLKVCPPPELGAEDFGDDDLLEQGHEQAISKNQNCMLFAEIFASGLDEESVRKYLRSGEVSWVEVLRVMMADFRNAEAAAAAAAQASLTSDSEIILPEYADPLGELASIVEYLLDLPEAKIGGANASDNQYADWTPGMFREMVPKTLQQVISKLDRGGYSPRELTSSDGNKKSDSVPPAVQLFPPSGSPVVGSKVDVFCREIRMWCSAEIVRVDSAPAPSDDPAAASSLMVTARCGHWKDTSRFDETLPASSPLLVPYRSKSANIPDCFLVPGEEDDDEEDEEGGTSMEIDPKHAVIVRNAEGGDAQQAALGGIQSAHHAVAADVLRILGDTHTYGEEKSQLLMANFRKLYRENVLSAQKLLQRKVVSAVKSKNIIGQNIISEEVLSSKVDLSSNSKASLSLNEAGGFSSFGDLRNGWLSEERSRRSHSSESASGLETAADWEKLVHCMQFVDYSALSLSLRLQCLQYLCDALLDTPEFNEIASLAIKESLDKLEEEKKLLRAQKMTKPAAPVEPVTVRSNKPPPKPDDSGAATEQQGNSRRTRHTANSSSDSKAAAEAPAAKAAASHPPVIPEAVESNEDKTVPESVLKSIKGEPSVDPSFRLLPLGEDRDGRLYWVFDNDCGLFSRLFVEEPVAEPHSKHALRSDKKKGDRRAKLLVQSMWHVYESRADVAYLLEWLSDWGIKEWRLKRKLAAWMCSAQWRPALASARPRAAAGGRHGAPGKQKQHPTKKAEPSSAAGRAAEEDWEEGSAMELVKDEPSAGGDRSRNQDENDDDDEEEHADMEVQTDGQTDSLTPAPETPHPSSSSSPAHIESVMDVSLNEEAESPAPAAERPSSIDPSDAAAIAALAGAPAASADYSVVVDVSSPLEGRSKRKRSENAIYKDSICDDELKMHLRQMEKLPLNVRSPSAKKPRLSDTAAVDAVPKSMFDILLNPAVRDPIVLSQLQNSKSEDLSSFDSLNQARQADLLVRVAAAESQRCRAWWQQQQQDSLAQGAQPSAHTLFAPIPAHSRQLGLTVKDVHGRIMVTGFDNNLGHPAPGLAAGLLVGDHILAMNGKVVFDLRSLCAAIAIRNDESDGITSPHCILVLRLAEPLKSKDFCREYFLDDETRHSRGAMELAAKGRADYYSVDSYLQSFSVTTSSAGSAVTGEAPQTNGRSPFESTAAAARPSGGRAEQLRRSAEWTCPPSLLGMIVRLLIDTCHPYVTPPEWRLKTAREFLLNIHEKVCLALQMYKCCLSDVVVYIRLMIECQCSYLLRQLRSVPVRKFNAGARGCNCRI
jgi:hypothetical protein